MSLKKKLYTFMITVCMSLMMCMTAFADAQSDLDDAIAAAQNAGVEDSAIEQALVGAGATTNSTNYNGTDPVVSVNGTNYYLTEPQANAAVSSLNNSVTNINNAAAQNSQVVDTVIDQYQTGEIATLFDNGKANLTQAAVALDGFTPLLSTLTGILATLAILGTTLFTACDICYLSFPLMHEKMDEAGNNGGGMSTQSKATGGSKFRFVTDDAVVAYQQTSQDGRSPWGAYLKRRGLTFICVALIVFLLLSGQITVLITFTLRMVSGIIEQIGNIATG